MFLSNPVFFALQGEGDGYDELKYSKAINAINTFKKVGNAWNPTDINTFYYSGTSSTGIDDFTDTGFKYYPN